MSDHERLLLALNIFRGVSVIKDKKCSTINVLSILDESEKKSVSIYEETQIVVKSGEYFGLKIAA